MRLRIRPTRPGKSGRTGVGCHATSHLAPIRFYDALIGGLIALLVSQIAVSRAPLAPLLSDGHQAFTELSAVVDQIRLALQRHDPQAARAALDSSRRLDAHTTALHRSVLAAGENVRLAFWHRRYAPRVQAAQVAVTHVDYAIRNTRMLARAALALARMPHPAPPELGTALTALSQVTRAAGGALDAVVSGAGDAANRTRDQARRAATSAVDTVAPLLAQDEPLPVATTIGQIRTVVIDRLRSAQTDTPEVLNAIDQALDLTPPRHTR